MIPSSLYGRGRASCLWCFAFRSFQFLLTTISCRTLPYITSPTSTDQSQSNLTHSLCLIPFNCLFRLHTCDNSLPKYSSELQEMSHIFGQILLNHNRTTFLQKIINPTEMNQEFFLMLPNSFKRIYKTSIIKIP